MFYDILESRFHPVDYIGGSDQLPVASMAFNKQFSGWFASGHGKSVKVTAFMSQPVDFVLHFLVCSLVDSEDAHSTVLLPRQVWLLGDKLTQKQPIETELLQFVTEVAAQGHSGSEIFDQLSNACPNSDLAMKAVSSQRQDSEQLQISISERTS